MACACLAPQADQIAAAATRAMTVAKSFVVVFAVFMHASLYGLKIVQDRSM
jgi:hypothetical protein